MATYENRSKLVSLALLYYRERERERVCVCVSVCADVWILKRT